MLRTENSLILLNCVFLLLLKLPQKAKIYDYRNLRINSPITWCLMKTCARYEILFYKQCWFIGIFVMCVTSFVYSRTKKSIPRCTNESFLRCNLMIHFSLVSFRFVNLHIARILFAVVHLILGKNNIVLCRPKLLPVWRRAQPTNHHITWFLISCLIHS